MTSKSQPDLRRVTNLTRREVKRLQKISRDDTTFARLINYFKCGPRDMLSTLDAIDAKFDEAREEFNANHGDVDESTKWLVRNYRACDWDYHYNRLRDEYKAQAGDN